MQETESFRQLVAHQPELGLDFIRETALRLGCPCKPTTAAQPANEPPHPDAQAESPPSTSAGPKPPPMAPALPAPAAAATAAAATSEAESSSGGEEAGTPRERGPPEGPATPPSRSRSNQSPLPRDAAAHSPVGVSRSGSSGLAIEVPCDGAAPSIAVPDGRLHPHAS